MDAWWQCKQGSGCVLPNGQRLYKAVSFGPRWNLEMKTNFCPNTESINIDLSPWYKRIEFARIPSQASQAWIDALSAGEAFVLIWSRNTRCGVFSVPSVTCITAQSQQIATGLNCRRLEYNNVIIFDNYRCSIIICSACARPWKVRVNLHICGSGHLCK